LAYRREYTSSGQDKREYRLGPVHCTHRREYTNSGQDIKQASRFGPALAHTDENTQVPRGKEYQATRPVSRFEHRRILNKTKSRSFSAVPRSAHTDENTQAPDKDKSSQTCTDENTQVPDKIRQACRLGPALRAHRREFTSSGHDRSSYRSPAGEIGTKLTQ